MDAELGWTVLGFRFLELVFGESRGVAGSVPYLSKLTSRVRRPSAFGLLRAVGQIFKSVDPPR